jgi:hypothetical protein
MDMTRTIRLAVLVACAGVAAAGGRMPIAAQSPGRLLQAADLVYEGAFRLPNGPTDETTFAWGGTALAFNPANKSLFLVGHAWKQRVAEIEIPEVINGATVDELKTARLRQPLTDVLRGRLRAVTSPNQTVYIGGLMPVGDDLLVTAYVYYDNSGTTSLSHFRVSTDFTKTDVAGPFQIGKSANQAGWVAGYMAPIPPEHQAALGGDLFTGQCCLSIITRTSFGPSLTVTTSADIGQKPAPATRVLGYPAQHATLGTWDTSGKLFNGTTEMGGVIAPPGTQSVLFFGRRGTGKFCYGPAVSDPALHGFVVTKEWAASHKQPDGTSYAVGENLCYDRGVGGKGGHAFPYESLVWAYDVNDLVKAKKGKSPWDIVPYATWPIELPRAVNARQIAGVAFDPETRRVFLSSPFGDKSAPVIHVLKIK